MIPSLPNLLPTANADSFHNETTAFSGTSDQTRERFDDLMKQALSPTAKQDSSVASRSQSETTTDAGASSAGQPPVGANTSVSGNPLIQPPTSATVHTSSPVSEWRNYAAGQNMAEVGSGSISILAQPKSSKSSPAASGASDAKKAGGTIGETKTAGSNEFGSLAVNAGDIPVQNLIPAIVPVAAPLTGKQNSAEGQPVSGVGTEASRLPANPISSPISVTGQESMSASAQQISAAIQNLNGTGPAAGTDPTESADANTPAVDPDTAPSQSTAPVAPAISGAGISAEVAAAFAGAKVLSPAPVKISTPKNSQTSAPVEANSSVQAAKAERIASADKTTAAEEAEDSDSKAAGPAPITPSALPIANVGAGDLKATKSPVESATDASPSNASGLPDSDAVAPTATQSVVNGTPAAQQDGLMKSAEKTSKATSPAGNFLPGAVVSANSGNNLPSRADQLAANGAVNLSASSDPATVTATAGGAVAGASAAILSTQAVERMHDMVTMHALRLGSNPTDSLQVVIKPGAGTQLSLELRQSGSGVEAHAVLQQGDFNHLNERWSDLQSRLEQRGIRLAPLTDDSATANGAGGQSQTFEQNKNQSTEPRDERAFASSATVTFAQPAARATAKQGWETWA